MKEQVLVLKSFRISKAALEFIHKKPKSGAWLRNAVARAIEAELQMQKTA